ncbi:energy-coupling factor transporter transmembrane component T family protein [Sediminivirga luteola]|jgi:energy-coupling factor transport system permease protein|uniref:ABC transporter n=1 Tax=Sediminivirga luteola TaxID=1774748 RepID=A0A8J2XL31_9MICO|nr:energy-coupling factor transporter transmembrane component T [Sediminivirga luteola]MCI2265012.1 energy-coupling factor transporter transmembrane protein EcfT [Sediminivirga luteola]GGA19362.1 ABC transporter [Sediminivirga luteola]
MSATTMVEGTTAAPSGAGVPAPGTDLLVPVRRRTLMVRTHPVVKLGCAFAVTLTVLLSVDMISAGVLLVALLLALPFSGLDMRVLLRRLWPIPVACVLSGYGTALLAPASGTVLVDWGPLGFSTGSILTGVAIAMRGMVLALAGVLVFATTDPTDLADGLAQRLRLSPRFVLSALAAFRLVGLVIADWRALSMARRARGVERARGPVGIVAGFFALAAALLVQSIRRGTRLAAAMEARGFGGKHRSWARPSLLRPRDAVMPALTVPLCALAAGLAVSLGTWNFIFL